MLANHPRHARMVHQRLRSATGRAGDRREARTRVDGGDSSVALSSEGVTTLIGGEGDNSDVGAAWAFTTT